MKEIKLKIQSCRDRDNMIIALANNGYSPRVEVEEDNVYRNTYYIAFKLTNTKGN